MENLNWVAVLLSVVSTYLVLHTLHESYELKWTEIEFGEFQVHPASMGKSQIRFLSAYTWKEVVFFYKKQVPDSCCLCLLQR